MTLLRDSYLTRNPIGTESRRRKCIEIKHITRSYQETDCQAIKRRWDGLCAWWSCVWLSKYIYVDGTLEGALESIK